MGTVETRFLCEAKEGGIGDGGTLMLGWMAQIFQNAARQFPR